MLNFSGRLCHPPVSFNGKFPEASAGAVCSPCKFTVVDDGTSANETRLGAVRDIQFAVDKCKIDDDMLVIAGDNLLDFSFAGFLSFAEEKGTSYEEKPEEPKGSLVKQAD